MLWVTIQGHSYNLAHLVRYELHVGQREVGGRLEGIDTVPVFADFDYAELVFSDGTHVSLQAAQTDAFLRLLERHSQWLDLDQVEADSIGAVVIRGTTEADDIVLPADAELDTGRAEG